MVVIKAPIIAENRNQTIPKEIPVMKFRHGQKFGNSSYVWSSIMSAAAQLVIQEVKYYSLACLLKLLFSLYGDSQLVPTIIMAILQIRQQ